MLAQSTVKGRPTAIPAYMQQEGIPAAAPLTFQSPAGDAPYPSSHVAPVDDTPMPQADLISQSPAVLVPDSCVGQVRHALCCCLTQRCLSVQVDISWCCVLLFHSVLSRAVTRMLCCCV